MCRNSAKWLYRLDRAHAWDSGVPTDKDRFFFDRKGRLRLVVEQSGKITITAGYSWNGCDPKVCFLDVLWGTPDGVVHAKTGRPKTYFASLIHDALYQFLPAGLPYTRKQVDAMFLGLMAESDFRPRWIYWSAVRLFGDLVWPAMVERRKHRGVVHAFDDSVTHDVTS